jgi:hypothetical protein
MTCQEFWKTMPEEGSGHFHVRECAACAARVRREAELAGGMRALAAENARLGTPPRVEVRLLAAFRAQNGTPMSAGPRRRWIPAVTWAAALAATIVAGFFLMRPRVPEAGTNPPPRHVEVAALEGTANALDAALEEGYLPLPGAQQLAPADDLNVVHVELPRSAMMQVGIDVSPDRANEAVLADVMVGSDGLARAVRFVDAGSD